MKNQGMCQIETDADGKRGRVAALPDAQVDHTTHNVPSAAELINNGSNADGI